MKLIEADKVERAINDYWKAQVDKALTLTFIDGNEVDKRINSYLKHNYDLLKAIDELPSAEQDTTTYDSIPAETGENDGDRTSGDCISRTQAIDKFIDGLEEIFADLRERHVDDSVCGLCEYDGAYMGQSGDWCNECPGFDRDDCFKLSDKTRKKWTDKIIKALPSAQPEPAIPLSWIEGQIKWLKSMDNAFATLSAEQISALVNKWKDEQDG